MQYTIKYPVTSEGAFDIIYMGSYMEHGSITKIDVLIHKVNRDLPKEYEQNFCKILQSLLAQNKIQRGQKIAKDILKYKVFQEEIFLGLPLVLEVKQEEDHWVLIYPSFEPFIIRKDLVTLQKLYRTYNSRLHRIKVDFKLDRIFTEGDEFIVLDYGFVNEVTVQTETQNTRLNKVQVWLLGQLCIQYLFDSVQRMQFKNILKQGDQPTITEYLRINCVKSNLPIQINRMLAGIFQLDIENRINWSQCGTMLSEHVQKQEQYQSKLPIKQDQSIIAASSWMPKRVLSNNSNHVSNRSLYAIKHSAQVVPNDKRQSNSNFELILGLIKNVSLKPKQHVPKFHAHRQLVQQSLIRPKMSTSQNRNPNQSMDESKDMSISSYAYALWKVRQNLDKRSSSENQMQTTFNLSTRNADTSEYSLKSSMVKQSRPQSALRTILRSGRSSSHESEVYIESSKKINVVQQVPIVQQIPVSIPTQQNDIQPLKIDKDYFNNRQPFLERTYSQEKQKPPTQLNQDAFINNDSQMAFQYNILNVYQNQMIEQQPKHLIRSYQPTLKKPLIQESLASRTKQTHDYAEIQEIESIPEIKMPFNQTRSIITQHTQNYADIPQIYTSSEKKKMNIDIKSPSQKVDRFFTPLINVYEPPRVLDFTTHVNFYKMNIQKLDIIGKTVAVCITLLDAQKNVWVIPMFLVFKRMLQLRYQVLSDLKRDLNAGQLINFFEFKQSPECKDLQKTLEEEQVLLDQEAKTLLGPAKRRLHKLDSESQEKLSDLLNVNYESDITDIVYVYLYSQVLARVTQVVKSDKKKVSNLREWQMLQINVLASLLILEQPLYENYLFDRAKFLEVNDGCKQSTIDQYIVQLNYQVQQSSGRLREQYEI